MLGLAFVALGCRFHRKPPLYNGEGLSKAPATVCAEFRVNRIDMLPRVASPSIVGANTRAVGAVTASTVQSVHGGDPVWVDFDRNGPSLWKQGDHGTLEIDAEGKITRIRHGLMPTPCPPARP